MDVPDALYTGGNLTLLLFVRASCPACESAAPTFARLVSGLEGTETDVRVLTPVADRARQLEYVNSLGLDENRLIQIELRALKVRSVPTAVLVNHRGVILGVSEGTDELESFAASTLARAGGR
jgi:hypothetical protein